MDDINYQIGLIHLRLDKLEKKDTEFNYTDVCIYMCVFYIIYKYVMN